MHHVVFSFICRYLRGQGILGATSLVARASINQNTNDCGPCVCATATRIVLDYIRSSHRLREVDLGHLREVFRNVDVGSVLDGQWFRWVMFVTLWSNRVIET